MEDLSDETLSKFPAAIAIQIDETLPVADVMQVDADDERFHRMNDEETERVISLPTRAEVGEGTLLLLLCGLLASYGVGSHLLISVLCTAGSFWFFPILLTFLAISAGTLVASLKLDEVATSGSHFMF